MVHYQDDFIRISVCTKKKVLMNSSVNSIAVRDKSIIFLLLHHLLFRFSIKDLARELQRFPYIL